MPPSVTDKPTDVLVIGAGVIGLACAFRLAREGHRVQLIDRDQPGMGASFGNAGHIATEQIFPLASPHTLRSALRLLLEKDGALTIRPKYLLHILPWLARFVWASRPAAFARGVHALASLQTSAATDLADLLNDAGASNLLHMNGHLLLIERAASLATARSEIADLAKHGVAAEWRTPEQISTLAPDITAPIQGAYHFGGTGHVDDPFAVCQTLLNAFTNAGGSVSRGAVAHIKSCDGRFVAHTNGGQQISAMRVLLCAGAWSAALAKQLGYHIPLDTERGYHITLPNTAPRFAIPIASYERKVIMTPMACGLRMTGTVEFGGLKLPPDPQRYEILKRHMRALVPDAPTNTASEWMGFRPSLPDHLPVIGRVPDGREIYFAFGHQHLGLTLSGVTARLVAEVVAGRTTDIDLAAFGVERF